MAEWKLRGKVNEGMFPNERVFVVTDNGGNQYAVIVPEEFIDGSTIRVNVIESRDGLSLVTVPGEHLDLGRTISVSDSELVPVA